MKLELSRHTFAKCPNVKFRENPSSGSRIFTCGWTDGRTYDKANSRFPQFCERAYKVTCLLIKIYM